MRRLVPAVLAAFGLVSARRFDALSRAYDSLKGVNAEWRKRASDAATQQRSLEAEVKRQSHLVAKLRSSIEKGRQRQDDIKKLRLRLADAERELMVARDHLMAIEVKLDILEGTPNVLDKGTRGPAPHDQQKTGAHA